MPPLTPDRVLQCRQACFAYCTLGRIVSNKIVTMQLLVKRAGGFVIPDAELIK